MLVGEASVTVPPPLVMKVVALAGARSMPNSVPKPAVPVRLMGAAPVGAMEPPAIRMP